VLWFVIGEFKSVFPNESISARCKILEALDHLHGLLAGVVDFVDRVIKGTENRCERWFPSLGVWVDGEDAAPQFLLWMEE
jgi:hypothetical protein